VSLRRAAVAEIGLDLGADRRVRIAADQLAVAIHTGRITLGTERRCRRLQLVELGARRRVMAVLRVSRRCGNDSDAGRGKDKGEN